MAKIKEEKNVDLFILFLEKIAIKTLFKDFQSQLKTIRPSAKWSMLFSTGNI